MKTAEQILAKHTRRGINNIKQAFNKTEGHCLIKQALQAMREYAEQFRQPDIIKSLPLKVKDLHCAVCGCKEFWEDYNVNDL